MLTPQEVSERVFAKATFGGYNMAMVDEFLDVLTADYSTLYNENAVLKGKMKVLVDKVEEYKSTEEAMRKALMAAQRMADDLVKEAEQKKSAIIRQAEDELSDKAEQLRRQVQAEERRLAAAQAATADYVRQVQQLQERHAAQLAALEEISTPVPTTDARVDEAARAIDDSVQRILAQQSQLAAQELAQEKTMEDTTEFAAVTVDAPAQPSPAVDEQATMRFGDLQFGRNYEIK
ncbi:MAG: DivIVA domain-containing protein, partial [Oscillospiraceae bacterium]|nr:DivIVA domain-containing protein [Oscillospiraceae bacterium]